MSDRTYLQAVIYHAPEEERAAILAALRDGVPAPASDTYYGGLDLAGCANEWPTATNESAPDDAPLDVKYPPIMDRVEFGDRYGWDECPLDSATTLGYHLAEVAPGATFCVWVDPYAEYPGEIVAHAPDLGTYTGTCGEDGSPTINAYEIRRLLDDPAVDDDPRAFLRKVRDLAGVEWEARFASFREQAAA